MNKDVVIIKKLYKEINKSIILNDINLNLKEGLIYGIIGGNGSGKSMLLKAICGLLYLSSGSIEVFGTILNNNNFPSNTSAVLDAPGLLPQYTVFKNLKILASIKDVAKDEDIKEAISLVGLDYNDKRTLKKYSLGMKQKANIAQALMEKPKLLLLDEPMNGLDEDSINNIRSLLLDLKNNNITIVITSHNSKDIEILCDEVYSIKKGVLSSAGGTDSEVSVIAK
ncbi:ABC transporter ATP-binding protein [Clostridium algidicarnis]|uniref:ABC transporter ATP-binding protein n=1 Tax=Clostridium algidicarnis TaxID=37659 RepID=UPI001C0B12F9|nr:ABC transporter ATP-binding protein [Clostridium algidicarnis]MBU3227713.1 ABC transporter ATP-binding protein [Clostridium algidicarnis]MBU3251465.1 ABC transporter ATP-binding protein [Clostridium algidicarnis]